MQLYLNGKATTLSDYAEDDLARAVVISLFSWRRADEDDVLPGESRYGWWADTFSEGDPIGSKLWLLIRSKLTDETLLKAKEYAEEALQWLIEDRIASSVTVTAERGGMNRLDLSVVIVKPDNSQLDLRFQNVWERQ